MTRAKLDALLAEIRSARDQTLAELGDITEADFSLPTTMQRWDDVRRLLLRFGDHMREHANQIEDTRQDMGRAPSMPARMLAEAELAWGQLLGANVGLTDDDLDTAPRADAWSVRQVLEHILSTERDYLDAILAARAAA